jgi:ElaB/YqjD/DUF883 family membrane-anchored ribosome-binding protein
MDAQHRESAADVGTGAGSAARMKRTIADKAEELQGKLNDFGRQAADKLDNSRNSTASALEWTASSIHSGANQISDLTHSAADRLQETAHYVRETDWDRVFDDVQAMVKRYPGPAIAIAAVLGFVIARGLGRLSS